MARVVADGSLSKPEDYDPATDKKEIRPRFHPNLCTPEQLTEIERVLRMVAATQVGTENGS
jgi:hypothetical protein